MTDNTLTIKMTRNRFLKARQYTVKVDGSGTQVLNYSNPQTELKMLSGKYSVEVSNGSLSSKMDITLSIGTHKILQINPGVTYELMRFIFMMIGLSAVIAQIIIKKSVFIPFVVMPFIPLLFLRKKQFPDSFVLTCK